MSIPLVLPPSWVTRINQLAMKRGVNRSALIREAIRATYFEGQDSPESVASVESDMPSASERGTWAEQ